jgi:hypothetical protein
MLTAVVGRPAPNSGVEGAGTETFGPDFGVVVRPAPNNVSIDDDLPNTSVLPACTEDSSAAAQSKI